MDFTAPKHGPLIDDINRNKYNFKLNLNGNTIAVQVFPRCFYRSLNGSLYHHTSHFYTYWFGLGFTCINIDGGKYVGTWVGTPSTSFHMNVDSSTDSRVQGWSQDGQDRAWMTLAGTAIQHNVFHHISKLHTLCLKCYPMQKQCLLHRT